MAMPQMASIHEKCDEWNINIHNGLREAWKLEGVLKLIELQYNISQIRMKNNLIALYGIDVITKFVTES